MGAKSSFPNAAPFWESSYAGPPQSICPSETCIRTGSAGSYISFWHESRRSLTLNPFSLKPISAAPAGATLFRKGTCAEILLPTLLLNSGPFLYQLLCSEAHHHKLIINFTLGGPIQQAPSSGESEILDMLVQRPSSQSFTHSAFETIRLIRLSPPANIREVRSTYNSILQSSHRCKEASFNLPLVPPTRSCKTT